jgi:DNA topoisomerase-1
VESTGPTKKQLTNAVERVAASLGNTPAVCRKCYIHPAILESYIDGELARTLGQRTDGELADDDLPGEEARVLRFLERRLAKAARPTMSAA